MLLSKHLFSLIIVGALAGFGLGLHQSTKFPVRISEGVDPARAAAIVTRCEKAYAFLNRTLGLSPAISIEVLSKKDWTAKSVYGMPHYVKGVLTVAGEPNEFWKGIVSLVAQQNPSAMPSLQAVYGGTSTQFDLGRFFDLLVVHELGHAFKSESGSPFPRLWLNEFYANLVLEAYIQNVEPEALPRLRAFPRAFENVAMPRRSLFEFDGSSSPENYAWYQALLHRFAAEVFATAGTSSLTYLTQLSIPPDVVTESDFARFFGAGSHPELAKIVDSWPATIGSAGQSGAASSLKVDTVDASLESGSPDGRWGVVQIPAGSGKLFLRDMKTGSDRPIASAPGVADDFFWSMDSAALAFTVAPHGDVYREKARLWTVSVSNAEPHQLFLEGTYLKLFGATLSGEWFYKTEEPPANGARGPWTKRYFLTSNRGSGPGAQIHTVAGGGSLPVAMLPDGKALIIQVSGALARYDLATGQQRPLGITGTVVRLSPDGRLLAFRGNIGGPGLFISALDDLPVKRTVRLTDLAPNAERVFGWWTIDRRFVVPSLGRHSSAAFRIDVDSTSGTARGPLTLIARDVDYPSISPDGRQIAFSSYSGTTSSIVDAKGGALSKSSASQVTQLLGWRSPQVVLQNERGSRITAWDTKTGTVSPIATIPENLLGYVPSLDAILYETSKESGNTIKARPLGGGPDRVITTEGASTIAVTNDGRRVAYSRTQGIDGPFEIVLAGPDGKIERRIPTKTRLDPAAWSPDAKFLLVYEFGWPFNRWLVMDVATAATRLLLTGTDQVEWESADYPGAAWSADGSFIVIAGYQSWREPLGKSWSGIAQAVLDESSGQSTPAILPASATGRTQLVFLGTGTPVADPDRSGPALALVAGNQSYLVDAGPGIVRRAAATRVPSLAAQNLRRVFITHLHSDHTLGLPDLMFSPWTLNRQAPLDVYGPAGVAEMTAAIEQAWKADVQTRLGSGEGLSAQNYRAVPHALRAGRVYEDANIKVDAIPVQHGTWSEAFGFRFQTVDRVIVVSGDTRPTPAIAEACNGCDVLVHEVYATRAPKFQEYDKAFHTSVAELAELAKKARPRLLVLYHTLGASSEQLIAQIRAAGYSGLVLVAQDLDVY